MRRILPVSPEQLGLVIEKLRVEREASIRRAEEITALFERIGVTTEAPRQRTGRPTKTARHAQASGHRGSAKSRRPGATKLILDAIGQAGSKGVATSDLQQAWESDRRSGQVYTVLNSLAKSGRIIRKPNKEGRGSRYILARD